LWPEILLSDCGKPYPGKRDVHPHCSTIQMGHTQGDSEGKFNVLGNESIDNYYRKRQFILTCVLFWMGTRKRGLFESKNTTALWMI
jgi:hypothetical protein